MGVRPKFTVLILENIDPKSYPDSELKMFLGVQMRFVATGLTV